MPSPCLSRLVCLRSPIGPALLGAGWLCLLAAAGPARAGGPAGSPKVAVLDLRAQGVEEAEARTLTGVLLSGLARGGGIDLFSKADLASILDLEQTKLLAGCPAEDPGCVAEHGGALGDAILIWGSVGRIGDQVVISAAAVDMRAGTGLGRASRTVAAGDGERMIAAAGELADELRGALGLASEATWTPLMSLSLRIGGVLGDYLQEFSPERLLGAFSLEACVFIVEAVPIFLRIGLTLGGGERDALFIPATLGVKYRFVREWLTPYLGLGLGLEFLDFSGDRGGVFSVHLIGGLELNPWKRFGLCLEAAFNFSQTFATRNFTQFAGELHLGAIYRF